MMIIRCRSKHRIREVYLDISRMIQYGCAKWEQPIENKNDRVNMIRSAAKSDHWVLPTKGYSSTGVYLKSRYDNQSPYRSTLGSRSLASQLLSRQLDLAKPMQFRTYCTDNEPAGLPLLTDLKVQENLDLFANISHQLMVYFAIKPQLDREFSTRGFLETTKMVYHDNTIVIVNLNDTLHFSDEWLLKNRKSVIPIIAAKLRSKDLDGLQYMVTHDVLEQIKRNLPKFTESQLEELLVDPEELAFSFINEMNISEDTRLGTKRLQVLSVHHLCKHLKEVKAAFAKSFANVNQLNPFTPASEQDPSKMMKVYILNYRFSRTFNLNTGEADDWTVDGLNHSRKLFSQGQLFS